AFSPRYAQLLGDQKPLGRPLGEVFPNPEMAEFVSTVREVYHTNSPRTIPNTTTHLPNEHGHPVESHLTYTIVPSHERTGEVDGAIIYAVDMTEQRVKELEEERERLKLIIENCLFVALGLFDVQTQKLLQASHLYLDIIEQTYGFKRDEIIGRKWEEVCIPATCEEGAELLNSVLESRKPTHWREYRSKAVEGKETIWDWGLTPVMN